MNISDKFWDNVGPTALSNCPSSLVRVLPDGAELATSPSGAVGKPRGSFTGKLGKTIQDREISPLSMQQKEQK